MRIIIQRLSLLTILFILAVSCEKKNETTISSHFGTESHKMGENCMNCHRDGGDGEGWFIVAGTVYDSVRTNHQANGTMRLYSSPDTSGLLIATVEVDGNGNFYTTEFVDVGIGLYPEITGASGDVRRMQSAAFSGQCNSCHNENTTSRIWVK